MLALQKFPGILAQYGDDSSTVLERSFQEIKRSFPFLPNKIEHVSYTDEYENLEELICIFELTVTVYAG